jgi:anti-anti-sigma factor
VTATSESPPLPTPRFEVNVQSDWRDAWVVAAGCLDSSAVPALQLAIEEALGSEPRKLHLVVAEVTSMDSAALAVLDAAAENAQAKGCKIVLHRPRRSVRDLLDASGLNHLRITNRLVLG